VNRIKSLFSDLRFYIITGSFLLSLCAVAYMRLTTVDNYLFYIRTGQIYGLCAGLCLYMLLAAAPLKKWFPKKTLGHLLGFCGPALALAAAYFACLHVSITFFKQLGGFNNVGVLPNKYQWAALLGVSALSLLAVLGCAAVLRRLKWKKNVWALRIGYAASIFVVSHALLIGPHMRKPQVRAAALSAVIILFSL